MQSGEGRRQVQESFSNIDKTLRDTNRMIQEVRLKNEKLQKESRLYDDKRSKERYNSIQEEAIQSSKKNTALEMKWSELKEEQECEKLYQAIQEQKSTFKNIIDGKERLIQEFTDELKKKDDDYVKMLKDQSQDIKLLVGRMRSQFFTLRDQNLKELEEIQRKFEAERKSYIKEAMDTVDKCFQSHIDAEEEFALKRVKAEQDFTKKIDDLRVDGAKNYASTKIRMETEIQELEKYFEEMKALYQLNTEKLDYNLKVLREKKDENNRMESEMTKKERILSNKLRALKEEYEKAEKSFKEQNKSLTQDYKRITRQFKELQRKFKHFEKADLDQYNEIQAMNEAEVQELKDKIIKCDVTIHIQQLGMQWAGTPPSEQKVEEKAKNTNAFLNINEAEQGSETRLVVGEVKLNELVNLLLTEADFMFDDKMREELEKASLETKLNEKLELLKKTLNIDSIDELNMLFEEMANRCKWVSEKEKQAQLEEKLRKEQQLREEQERQQRRGRRRVEQRKQEEEKKEEGQPEAEPRVDMTSDFKLDSTLIVDFLIEWMSSKDDRKRVLEKIIKKSIDQLSERQKKEHIAREGKKYWEKLTQVLPDRTFRIWKVLDKALTKYYELLLARQKLIDETGELHTQNEELKKLLNQYLQINHELLIPPTRLMEKDV